MHSTYLDVIKRFEGYTSTAKWDYSQHTNGYGTKAAFPGERIDRAEAERRFLAEVSSAEKLVESFAAGLDSGTKAALTSLTYNAGTRWMGSGLGKAVQSGDLEAARDCFLKYNTAGGEILPGLVSRRSVEAGWFAMGSPGSRDLASSMATRDIVEPPNDRSSGPHAGWASPFRRETNNLENTLSITATALHAMLVDSVTATLITPVLKETEEDK